MNYIGSKHQLAPFIYESTQAILPLTEETVVCDLFAGTGAMGRYFKAKGHRVIANDVEDYAYALNAHYIGNNEVAGVDDLLEALNASPAKTGLFVEHYSPEGREKRQYFTVDNAKKIDGIRQKIQEWSDRHYISPAQERYLLAASLEALDRVANTASVYAAYLKSFKKTALAPIEVTAIPTIPNTQECTAYQSDANELIHSISGDILYLDPPYNGRQYGNYYHILNTFIRYDNFEPRGKTGMRDYYRSDYCKRPKVKDAFRDLVAAADFPVILLSYNNEGLMSVDEIQEIMGQYGDYRQFQKSYPRYKADTKRDYTAKDTVEYLHCLVKTTAAHRCDLVSSV